MAKKRSAREMTRRELLASGITAGSALVVGTGFVAHTTEAWATETTALAPATMATLIQIARDTYPHDKIADQYYAVAVKGHDEQAAGNPEFKAMIEDGVAALDAMAAEAGHGSYLGTGWERDRVALLKEIEDTAFFQTIRGGLVVGLYNQREIWGNFGYEGPSFEHGGYIERGFDDIAWL
ncbi:MAG: Twin-arginine translocation pathway signal [Pseudomonadota bacterium]